MPTVLQAYGTTVSSSELYLYTLRLLVLEYINEPRFQEKYVRETVPATSVKEVSKSERRSRRVSWFSSGTAPVKGPTEVEILQNILPKLEKYLSKVAVGKVKLLNDKLRRSYLKFYNDVFLNPTMTQTLKSMQRFEELIVHFTKAANGELNKLIVDNIQKELYTEISCFINILIELGSASITGSLKIKLEQYKDSVKPRKTSLKKITSELSIEPSKLENTVNVTLRPTFRLNEVTHSSYFMELFQVDEVQLQQDIITAMKVSQNHVYCEELLALRRRVANDTGQFSVQDFSSEKYYENWKTYEMSEIAVLLDKFNDKGKSAVKYENLQNIIPKNSRDMFTALLVKIFRKESVNSIDSLGLSQTGLFFLTKASKYWRVDYHSTLGSLSYTAANLSILDDEELNPKLTENLFSFINTRILRFEDNSNVAAWNDIDQRMWLVNLFHTSEQCINSINNLLTAIYTSTKPKFSPVLSFYYTYVETDPSMILFKKRSAYSNTRPLRRLRKTIFETSERYYISLLEGVPKDNTIEIQHIQNVAELIIEQIKSIQKRYSKPLLDNINLSFECATVLIEALASDAPTMIKRAEKYNEAKRGEAIPPVDALEAYSVFKEVHDIYSQVKPGAAFPFKLESLFSRYLNDLCGEVCSRIPRVIESSIQNESWLSVNSETNFSSSVVDIFKMINESIAMFRKLQWEDKYENAKVITLLLKAFSDGIHTYATNSLAILEKDLLHDSSEMNINGEENKENVNDGRFSSEILRNWSFTDMKNAFRSSSVVMAPKPYQFKKRTCVILNNLEAMIQKINDLDEQLKAEQLSEVIVHNERKMRGKKASFTNSKQTLHQIYTVRVIGAENIKGFSNDGLSNAFVSLVDTKKRSEIGKTKTVAKSINPVWDEEFEIEIPVEKSRSIALTVWHRPRGKLHQLSNYDICGNCSLLLDHRKFTDDGFPNEVMLLLGTQGRLLLEVSLESEKMDPLFCIGRAYRTLTRTRDRAIELVINKFVTFIDYAFSRATLRAVCGNYGTTPAPKDVIYDAIVPLFDYLNSNLSVIASTLSQTLLFKVMLKGWSYILGAADSLLLPQLTMAKYKRLSGTKSRWENAVSSALGNAYTVSGYGRALTQLEIETIFVWVNALCIDFFHNHGEGPPLSDLKNKHYQTILLIPAFFDKSISELKREVDTLSPDYAKYLNQVTITNSSSRKFSVKLSTLARNKTIMANASKKRRSKIRQQVEELESGQLERNAEILDVLLRTLIAKGEMDYVHKHLTTREKVRKKVATEKLVKAAVDGQKNHRTH